MELLKSLSAFVFAIIFTIFGDIICYGINFLLAKYVIFPFIGTNVCYALNLVFNTNIFKEATFPLFFATASFVGHILFKSNNISYKSSK